MVGRMHVLASEEECAVRAKVTTANKENDTCDVCKKYSKFREHLKNHVGNIKANRYI